MSENKQVWLQTKGMLSYCKNFTWQNRFVITSSESSKPCYFNSTEIIQSNSCNHSHY